MYRQNPAIKRDHQPADALGCTQACTSICGSNGGACFLVRPLEAASSMGGGGTPIQAFTRTSIGDSAYPPASSRYRDCEGVGSMTDCPCFTWGQDVCFPYRKARRVEVLHEVRSGPLVL